MVLMNATTRTSLVSLLLSLQAISQIQSRTTQSTVGLNVNGKRNSNLRRIESTDNSRNQKSDLAQRNLLGNGVLVDEMKSPPGFKKEILYWTLFACGKDAVCEYERSDDNPNHTNPLLHCGGCNCDSNCRFYGDCCPDIYTAEELYNNEPKSPASKDFSCMSPYLKRKHGMPEAERGHIYVVDKCPENFADEEVKGRCEIIPTDFTDSKLYLPVYNLETRRTYRNWYCAVCHKDERDTLEWRAEISCTDYVDASSFSSPYDLISFLSDKSFCDIKLVADEKETRECSSQSGVTEECPGPELPTAQVIDSFSQSCSAFTDTVEIISIKAETFSGHYKNIFCAFKCGYNVAALKANDGSLIPRSHSSTTFLPTKSFSMLFNFNPVRAQEQISGSLGCSENEVYDPHQMSCRKIFCSKGRLISRHSCISAFKSTRGVGYIIRYTLIPQDLPYRLLEPLTSIWDDFYDHFYSKHRMYLFEIRALFENCTMNVIYKTNDEKPTVQEIVKLQIEFSLVVGENFPPSELEVQLMNIMTQIWVFRGKTWISIAGIYSDSKTDILSQKAFVRTRKNIFGDLPEVYLSDPSAFIEISPATSCTQIELNETEYVLENSTSTVSVLATGRTHQVSEYLVVKDRIRICVNYTGKFTLSTNATTGIDQHLERIFTLSSFTVSLVCLALTVMAYMIVPIRYTVPGKTTIALVLSLFAAQLLFLVGGTFESSPWLCRCLGVALHYFWLKVFCWKNIMAFHMFMVFTRPLKYRSKEHGLLFLRYCLYAFIMPAALIGAFIVAHLVMSDSQAIGYDGKQCFLGRPIDIGLAFALPIGLIVIANGYFFLRTVLVIRKMSEMEKHSNKPNVRQTRNYIKLSFPLGLTWLIGFVANAVQLQFIWYVFILVNGSLGLIIFVCQVCNHNMLCHIKLKFGLMYSDASKSSKVYDTQDS